jgi:exodeoxyribonuclease VII large subunit
MPMTDPKDESGLKALSVSDLTRQVKRLLEEDIGGVFVEGEISNWRVSPAGHAYFILKDEKAQISCVMFRSALSRVKFAVKDGQQVLVAGRVTVYEARGQYQILVERIQEAGLGVLFQRFNELKKKLEAEGLFAPERKKELPMLPQKIGIVTSPSGAALRDILNVLGRRFAGLDIYIAPCRVQGAEAPGEIVAAIKRLNRHGEVEAIIAGRGGGSIEDLWAFNEEIVARAIAASKIPVISAVGHETDFTIADFVADLRAPTPSAAAELVVADREELFRRLTGLASRLRQAMVSRVEQARLRLEGLVNNYAMRSPLDRLAQARQRLDELNARLAEDMRDLLGDSRQRHETLSARLLALDPTAVLGRGYSIVTRARDEKVIVRPGQARLDEQIRIQLSEGRLRAVVVRDEEDFLS